MASNSISNFGRITKFISSNIIEQLCNSNHGVANHSFEPLNICVYLKPCRPFLWLALCFDVYDYGFTVKLNSFGLVCQQQHLKRLFA